MKTKRNLMVNNDEQKLNHPMCENKEENENYKEDNLTSEEDRTQQDKGEERKTKEKR